MRLNNYTAAALFLIALFAALAVFGKYQFDLANERIEATRKQIREYRKEHPALVVSHE